MSGWSSTKRKAMEKAFYAFLDRCYINSKDYGRVCLGESLYWGQRHTITQIFDALESDIHDIYILKSRQLGISTLVRALIIFFEGMFEGLKGAIVFDTDQNKQESRAELEVMINDLPKTLKFPKIKTNNRAGLTLYNNSGVLFMSAGIRKSKSSGTLGRSVGLSLATLSELCSYDNDEGLEAFEQSLSDQNPDRLYIRESTARGYNRWWEIWQEARKDPLHRKCIFLGWWSKESQRIDRDAIDFDMYGKATPTTKEIEKIRAVKEQYAYDVSIEQLAWIRRKMDPTAESGEEGGPDYEGSPIRIQEQPWTESEAFQQTGSVFFPQEKLTQLTKEHVSNKFKGYMFWVGAEFIDTRVHPAENLRMTELKVWEEPDPDGVYVMGVDPAFGENEDNDRSSIQVLRCYADGADQVAEYAWPLVTTYQLAWVIAALLGWYGQHRAEIRYILELNGPGTAVFNELKNLRMRIDATRHQPVIQDTGLADIFRNVRTYIYTRPDSMGAGYNWHWVCLALDTKLPTPTGWTTIGRVQTGDELYDVNGKISKVLGVSPTWLNHVCYRIKFDDGTSIVADEDHLWSVYRYHWDECKLRKTKDLRAGKYTIFVAKPLEGPLTNLPIHPYVLGVWLGDGCANGAHFYGDRFDMAAISKNIANCGYELGPVSHDRTVSRRPIVGLRKALIDAGLLNNKHIPQAYLRASYWERVALLQGLMDTDGNSSVGDTRQCSFSTSNEKIRDGVAELLRTLGFKAKYCVRENRAVRVVNDRNYVAAANYQFWFAAYPNVPMFRMGRKQRPLDTITFPARQKMYRIVKIEQVPSVPVKCLEIDSPTKLFLAGEGMVPTHNTNIGRKVTVMERLRDFVANGKLHVRSLSCIDEMKTVAREGDSIKAPQHMRDDRVFALSLAVHYWESKMMQGLIQQKRTREAEESRRRLSIVDQVALFNQNHLEDFFKTKKVARLNTQAQLLRNNWRYGGRRY